MTALACYDIKNFAITGYDVVTNRPKVAAYRAPGAPIAAFAVESAIDELARKLGMDPIALRLKNAARDGIKAAYGPTFRNIGYVETLEAAQKHPNYQAPLGPNQGRGVASGFWFNVGGESSARGAYRRGRHRRRGHRQPRHRRLARLDGDDGGRGARHAGGEVPAHRRRYRLDRLLACSPAAPHDVRHRHGGDAGGREGRARSSSSARR